MYAVDGGARTDMGDGEVVVVVMTGDGKRR